MGGGGGGGRKICLASRGMQGDDKLTYLKCRLVWAFTGHLCNNFTHSFCLLLLSSAYCPCNQYGPRSDCSHLGEKSDQGSYYLLSMIKSSLKCIWIYAADIKSRQHFQNKKNSGRKRVKKNFMGYSEVSVQNISVVSSSTGKYNIIVSVKFCHNQ